MSTPFANLSRGLLGKYGAGLRFPQLFTIMAGLFLLDVIIPDLIPFADEILLGLATFMIGSLKRKPQAQPGEKPPMKDITPKRPGSSG
ncbi:MAG: DUF6116 family protein [Thermoanaerobaculia bacterium]